ncbi:MAG: DUF512 domain-containing protein [Oscillospiraceae bacterium]|nr:DUF512 domain-containing protein [Oscillospiraceae bacterium]
MRKEGTDVFNTVASVDPGSPLEGKVFPGDQLLYVNHHPIKDVLDYKYWTYDRKLVLEFKTAGVLRVRKQEGRDLGLNFETYLMDKPTGCANKCVFCFIDQLPKGMRPTLYFKDDDARLSFLTGNYITCTNLSERELQRICDLRISPLNISVHATDPELRCRLLGNRRGGEIMNILRRFSEAGIFMECQIVCVPGWNDGEALLRTMRDLSGFYPQVESVSIVPVGLTKYREGLTPLSPFTPQGARDTVKLVEGFAAECREKYDSHIFFCSDEFYLKAGLPLPEDRYYEGYPQLENGVGLLRSLETDFRYALEKTGPVTDAVPFSIATGLAAEPYIRQLVELCGAPGTVYGVPNDFFGHTIDVAGLLTGQDLIRHLKGKDLGQRLLLPGTMLRDGDGVFLDDLSPADLERELGVPVFGVACDGEKLLAAMRGI